MGAISTRPITIAEFDKLDLPPNRKWELRNGEIVEMPFPSWIHKRLQQRIADLFRQAFPGAVLLEEMPFQIEATNDERGADVGITTKEREEETRRTRILNGDPELVVEVLSPSNNIPDLKKYRRLCFEHGTEVFLTVDSDDNTIEVHLRPGKQSTMLGIDDTLQFSLFDTQASIPVRAIFAGITLPETSDKA